MEIAQTHSKENMPQTERQETDIKPLTSFRFFAVAVVFLSHLSLFKDYPSLATIYDRFFYEGYVGVTFFFVLSGFILTYKYHSRLASLKWSELKRFFVSRISRIYPVYVLTFLVALPLVYQAIPKDLIGEGVRALLNLSLLQSFIPDGSYYFSYDGPAWSLSDEIFFYALFPFLLAVLVKIRGTSTVRTLGLAFGSWLLTLLIVWMLRDIEQSHWLFYIAPFFRISDFILGVLLCYLFLSIGRVTAPRILFTLFELAALGAFFVAFYNFPSVHQSLRYGVYYTPFIAVIIFLFAFRQGHISDLLSARLLVLGGEISFSFYLFHQLVIRYFIWGNLFDTDPVSAAVLAFLLSLCLSYVCYWLYESPARDILRKRFGAYVTDPAQRNLAYSQTEPTDHPASKAARTVRSSSVFVWASAGVIAAVVLVSYYPSLRLGFLGDIWGVIASAEKFGFWQSLAQMFVAQNHLSGYQIVSEAVLLVGYQFFHADSLGYHVVNMLLHLANVCVLYGTVMEIGRNSRIAILSALIYAGLPIYAQSVFSPADSFLGVGLFYLLGVWTWVRYLRNPSRKYYLLTLSALGLALLINQTSVTLVITLFLVDRLLIRTPIDMKKLMWRYALPGSLALIVLVVSYFVQGGRELSVVLAGAGAQTLANLAEYVALLSFPWGLDFQIIFALTPLALVLFLLAAIRNRSPALSFLGIETLLLLLPSAVLPRDSFTPRAFYLPAIPVAVVLALLFHRLWGEAGSKKMHVLAAASAALALMVLFNAAQIANAATDWTNVVRSTRQAYRAISPRHPTFADDTYLYFIGPPSIQDLSGLFQTRYGNSVTVAGSYDNASLSQVPYPAIQDSRADEVDSDADQIAGLRNHKVSFVYYFDNAGNPVEVPVDDNATTRVTPTLPVTFNASVRLEGYEITANSLKVGDSLVLLLYWRATQKVAKDYTVFVHLVDSDGKLIDGYDSPPRGGQAPTSSWVPGALIVDSIVVPMTVDIPSGTNYHLEIGLYDLNTLERLLLVDDRGAPFADKVEIGPFHVE